jgi:hypothetical protein
MPTRQERLFQASRIVEVVADDLCDHLKQSIPIREADIMELVKRLDLVVDEIRRANGASN